MVPVVCLFEVEANEVWLRGAAGGVLVTLVERHVYRFDVSEVARLAGTDAPPPLLSESRAASRIAVDKRDPDRVVILVLKFEPHYDSRLCVVGAGWIKRWRR